METKVLEQQFKNVKKKKKEKEKMLEATQETAMVSATLGSFGPHCGQVDRDGAGCQAISMQINKMLTP